jgi:hypothetical protein
MPAVQERLPLPRAVSNVRHNRRPFHPSRAEGTYRLPHDICDRLAAVLTPFKNREAAFTLAVFVARFWSMPGRVALPFPIDRRALAGHRELGLTEARVRGAIRTLEAVGFLARFVTSGSRYKATEEGLRRKPIPYQFGSDYAPLFIAANRRAAAARGRQESARRIQTSDSARGPSTASAEPSPKSPKSKSEAERSMIMGEKRSPPRASEPYTPLEAALEQLRQGVFGRAEASPAPGPAGAVRIRRKS